MIGWLFYVGKDIILPIVTAIILLQILYAASAAVARIPGLGAITDVGARGACPVGVILLLFAMTRMLVPSLPTYQSNLENLFAAWFPAPQETAAVKTDMGEMIASPGLMIDRGSEAVVKAISEFVTKLLTEVDIAAIAQSVLSSLTSFGGFVFYHDSLRLFHIERDYRLSRESAARFWQCKRFQRHDEHDCADQP